LLASCHSGQMRLFLVRHGITLHNIEGRYTGQADVPLAKAGQRQAQALGKRLAAVPLNAIVSSDLQRARATAEAIARYHALPVGEEPAMREVALGAWESCTYAEVAARDPDLVALRRVDGTVAPPGGESFIQVRERAAGAVERWYRQYPRGTVLCVSHAGVIEVLACQLLGIDLRHRRQFRSENASLSEFELNEDIAILVRWNDTAHLE